MSEKAKVRFGKREKEKQTEETEKHLQMKRTNSNNPYDRHRNNISLGFELEFSHL